MRRLMGADGAQAVCGGNAGGEQARGDAELLESTACGRQARAPSGIHLQILAISIIFSENLCCVHILLVICAILHRKNEHLFGRVQFG